MKPKMFWLSSMPHGNFAYSSLFLISISLKRLLVFLPSWVVSFVINFFISLFVLYYWLVSNGLRFCQVWSLQEPCSCMS